MIYREPDKGYKQRSSVTVIIIGLILVLAAILVYPLFQSYLSAGVVDMYDIIQWLGILFIILIGCSIVSVLCKRRISKKENEIYRARELADQQISTPLPNTEFEAVSEHYHVSESVLDFPTYRPPPNPDDDPYEAKPKGFARQQALKGYPQAPAQVPLKEPFSLDLSETDT